MSAGSVPVRTVKRAAKDCTGSFKLWHVKEDTRTVGTITETDSDCYLVKIPDTRTADWFSSFDLARDAAVSGRFDAAFASGIS